jgi:phosphoglycolate phosphatase
MTDINDPNPPTVILSSERHVRPEVLLWDWDNTLADGWQAITAAINEVFEAFAMPAWTQDETRARARHSMRETFPAMFGADWKRAAALFQQAYATRHLQHLNMMPDIESVLEAARPWPMAVVSNKDGGFVRKECEALGWTGRFAAVIGAGDAEADKPDPAPFHLALKPIGATPGPHIWYIGDAAIDMQAARACGCVAVLLGTASHDGGLEALVAAGHQPDLHFVDAASLAAYLRMLA